MKSILVPVFTVALLAGVFITGPASALTAGEVMDNMDTKQRAGFIAGAVDMASHLYAMNGKQTKSQCAVKWLFDNPESNREIHKFFDAHKDRDAVALLSVLIDRRCGK